MAAAPLPILYEDDHFVAVAKPPGMFVHRTELNRRERTVVLQTVRDQLQRHVFPVHRIDRPASGIVLLGLTADAASAAARLFRDHRVVKTYRILVRGFTPPEGCIDRPLTSPAVVRQEPLPALTRYRTEQRFDVPIPSGTFPTTRCSLLTAEPATGRFHQIRRHFNGIGHPVIGDSAHGDSRCNRWFRTHCAARRLMLHASAMAFDHPVTGRTVRIRCPLPGDMTESLERLKELTEVSDGCIRKTE